MALEVKLDDIDVKSKQVDASELKKNTKASLDKVKEAYDTSDTREETKEEIAKTERKLKKDSDLSADEKQKEYKKLISWFFGSEKDIVQTVDENTWQSWVEVTVDGETFAASVEGKEIAKELVEHKIKKIEEEINANTTINEELKITEWTIINTPEVKKKEEKTVESQTTVTSSDSPLDAEEGERIWAKMMNRGKRIWNEFWNDFNLDKARSKIEWLVHTGTEKVASVTAAFTWWSIIGKAKWLFGKIWWMFGKKTVVEKVVDATK